MADILRKQYEIANGVLYDRKINNAISIIEQWTHSYANPDEKQQFFLEIDSIRSNYYFVFQHFLFSDDKNQDDVIDDIVRKTYDLLDTVYACCLKQTNVGKIPNFPDTDNQNLLGLYFSRKVPLDDLDFQRIRSIFHSKSLLSVVAVVCALTLNLKACFSVKLISELMQLYVDGEEPIKGLVLSLLVFIYALYDDRIDYYPELQELFETRVEKEHAYEVLQILYGVSRGGGNSVFTTIMIDDNEKYKNDEYNKESIEQSRLSMNKSAKYVLENLLGTWVSDYILEEKENWRNKIETLAVSVGRIEYFSGTLSELETIILNNLRKGSNATYDYINYAHCCLIRNDRTMAVEYYRKALSLSKSYQTFCQDFRSHMDFLLKNNISPEIVELIEDHLFRDDDESPFGIA